MKSSKTWQLRKLLVAILLCVTFFAFATACGGSATGNEDPGHESASVLIVGGAPGEELGKEGDICFDSASRTLYVKDAHHWVETEYLSCEVEENALSVTFKDGSVKRYALSNEGETAACEHEFDSNVYAVHPAKCIIPGIGVKVCTKCHSAFPVIIPADGASHEVGTDGMCTICGEKISFTTKEDPADNTVVVQGVEGSKETKIVIPDEINGKDVKIAPEAFKGNTSVQEVEIQGSVSVGANAFEGCTNLETLTIKEGTESIGEEAFKGCENLDEVTIPESVTSVGANAFEGTGYYTNQEKWEIEEDHKVLYNNGVLLKAENYTAPAPTPAGRRNAARLGGGEYKLQENVRVIADAAFVGVENLTRVVLNEKLKTVGANAFGGSELESVTLSAGITNYEGLKELGESVKFFFRGGSDTYKYEGLTGVYYQSDDMPTAYGNFWHMAEGVPTIWPNLKAEGGLTLGGEYPTSFLVGETFSSAGLTVTANYEDGTTGLLEAEDFTVDSSAVNMGKDGTYTVKVTYLYVETSYEVTVNLNTYTVTIVYGNGQPDGSATVTQNLAGAPNYTLPDAPTWADHTFSGWKVGDGAVQSAGTEINISANTTITAQWEDLHTVTVNAQNATLSEDINGKQYTEGTELKFTVEVEKGYKLVSVTGATEQDGTYTVTVGKEDITITVTTAPVNVNATVKDAEGVTPSITRSQDGAQAIITVGNPAARVGYDFSGWKYAIEGGQSGDYSDSLTIALENADVTVTFTANWTPKEPVISVKGEGTENVETSYTFNEQDKTYTVTITGTPVFEGHEFKHWSVVVGTEEAITVEEGGTFTVPLSDDMTVTITAVWNDLYTVTLGAHENAAVSGLVTGYHAKGDTLTFTVEVDKGYKLVSVKNGDADVQKGDDGTYTVTVGEENITITVTTEQVKVTVNYAEDNYGVTAQVNRDDPAKATITVGDPTAREGFEFTGWTYAIKDGNSGAYSESLVIDLENTDVTVTFTATWTAKTPDVSFNLNGGTHSTEKYEVSELSEDNKYTITITGVPTYEKHRFTGWTATLNGENVDVTENQIVIGLADDMTVVITANWVEQVTVTYALGEHSKDSEPPQAQTVDKGKTVTLPEKPAATDGYEFAGWLVSGEEVARKEKTDITVTADVTVTAQWTQLYTLTVKGVENAYVTYDGEAQQKAEYYHTGDTVKITITAHAGYKLTSVKNGESELGVGGTYTVTVGTENITITVTTAEVAVTVKYAEEKGYGVEAQVNRDDPAKATITIAAPSKEGYTFDKWTYKIGEDGLETDYSESLVIELANADVTVTFTAHFNYEEYTLTVAERTEGNPQIQYKVGENGTYHIGETAHFTITVDEGYTVTKVSVDGTDLTVEDGYYTYTFGAASVTITVTTEKVQETQYTITVNYVGLDEGDSGENVVTLTLEPEKDYTTGTEVLFGVEISDSYKNKYSINAVTATGCTDFSYDEGTFTVGESDITITITLDRLYHVEVVTDTDADIIYDLNPVDVTKNEEGYYKNGTNLRVENIESDYTVTVTSGDVDLSVSVGGGYSFTVGTKDITIEIRFVRHTLTIEGDKDNVEIGYEREIESVDEGSYLEGETVIVNISAIGNYTVTVEISGVDKGEGGWEEYGEGEYWITMTADVTITITTEEIVNTYTVKLATGAPEYVSIGDFKVGDVTDNGPYKNGTTVTFTLTVNDPLYVITSVKNGEDDLTATDDGRYSVTISGANVEITVTTDYNYGTKENPLTIEQAIALGTAQCGTKEETWTKQMVYVRGVVAEAPTISGSQYKQFYLGNSKADDTTKLLVWATELAAEVDAPEKNDTVIIHGYIEYYQSKLELTGHSGSGKDYPTIVSNERGLSGIEVTNNDGATVKTSDGGDLPGSAENGTEITFKVTVSEEGKKAVVTVNGVTVNPDGEGNYKFTVHGDMEVDIKVVDASAATETTVGVSIPDYASKHNWTSNNKYSEVIIDDNITATMVTGTYSGIYNSSGQWQLYQSGGGSLTISAKNGATIKSVKITFDQKNDGSLLWNDTTYERGTDGTSGEIEVNDSSVTFTAKTTTPNKSNGQVKITAISVTYTGGKVLSDEDKVQAAAEAYELPAENKTYSEVKIYDLPTETTGGVTITWALTGTSDYCSIDGGKQLNVSVLPDKDTEVGLTATFHLNDATATNSYTVTIKAKSGGGETQTVYKKVTSVDELQEGKKIVFVYGTTKIAGGLNKDYLVSEDVTVANNEIKSTGNGVIWTLQKDGNNWKFLNEKGQALGATAVKKVAIGSGTMTWTISFASDGTATVKNTNTAYGTLYYNTGSPRFTTYTSTQGAIQIYIESTGA